ncbi:MAG: M48 family metallopeptidase [Alphaproteobacteria bacterium]
MPPTYEGHYSDGRSAGRRPVIVRVAEQGLIIASPDGEPVGVWQYADLKLAGEVFANQPVRLTNAADPDARLSVAEHGFQRPLYAFAPHLRRRRGSRGWSWRWAAASGLGIVAVLALIFVLLPRLAGPIAALVPADWEKALGAQVVKGWLAQGEVCTGTAGSRVLARLIDRLVAGVETPFVITVRVIDAGEANAFAAPGGNIVVLRGLIDFAESGDEVAGVLAHEIGHVVERHAMEAVVRAAGLSLIFQALVGDVSGLLSLAAGAGEYLLSLSYSRGAEAEADAVALDILHRADIRTDGLAALFARLTDARGGTPDALAFLSTHPPSRERAAAAEVGGERGHGAMSATDWQALRTICE